jgi:hypothetical protein
MSKTTQKSRVPDHSNSNHKGHNRQQGRDKRQEEKRKALEAHATQGVDTADLRKMKTILVNKKI